MDINDIVKSRYYTWQMDVAVKMNVNKKNDGTKEPNPFLGRVTVFKQKVGQAADMDMYVNAALRKAQETGHEYVPSANPPQREVVTNYPCVFRMLSNGEFQVQIMNSKTTKRQYFVDGRPATEAEIAAFSQWIPRKERKPWQVKTEFPYLNNLTNVTGIVLENVVDIEDDE